MVGKSCIDFLNSLRDNAFTRKKSKPRETWWRKVMGLKLQLYRDQDRQTTENSKTARKTVTQSQVSKTRICKPSRTDRLTEKQNRSKDGDAKSWI